MELSVYKQSVINKTINLNKYIILVSIFIIIIFLILIFKKDFYDYYEGTALVNDSNKISTMVNINELEKITNSKEIIIEGTTFSYDISSIDEENFVSGSSVYKKVNISLPLNSIPNIKNNSLKFNIILGKDTILNYVLKTIKGE